jgi:ribulose-phosphate 3-epimerase
MALLIAPSLLSADFRVLRKELEDVEAAGADLIHADVMDGHFVPNLTIGPMIVKAVRASTSLPIDAHLMIENPDQYVEAFAQAGADIITIHVETGYHLFRTIDMIRSAGKKAGIALNPGTPLSSIEELLEVIDLILIMTVNPGFGGQDYIASMTEKVGQARQMIAATGRHIDLQVDGGIKASNARVVSQNGANVLVMGTEIFHAKDYRQKIEEIRAAVNGSDERKA